MRTVIQSSRSVKVVFFVLLALAIIASVWLPYTEFYREWKFEGKSKSRNGLVQAQVINSSPENKVILAPPAPSGFTPQVRLGFLSGDEWEPAIAADRFGHVYMIYPQYGGVPGCPSCYSPTMIFQMSSDHGQSWTSPTVIYPAGSTSYQVDAQVTVDPADGRTVYVAWLQNNKSDILVGKSTDFGATWSFVTADHTNAGTDKPILAVRGQDVYVSYNHSQTAYVTYSRDGGATFTEVKMNQNAKLGWSLGGGGTVTLDDNVYFSWDGYEQNGGAKGNVNLYISKSTDKGATWTTKLLDVSASPPDCSALSCGWAFLGAAITMTSDTSGNLYALSAAGNGDIRIAWMDTRVAATGAIDRWNVYFRSSSNGGSTWTSEMDVSTYVSGYSYIFTDGFRFPYGDYFEMDVDEQGTNHLIFGEGPDYNGPGSIWYVKGK